MEFLHSIFLTFFIIILSAPILFFLRRQATKSAYKLKNNFLSPAEINFYRVLETALREDEFKVFAKVRLADIVEVNSHGKDFTQRWNKISQKHIDFLVCDKDLKPLICIELDDKSHLMNSAFPNDTFKNDLFTNVSLPLLRIVARRAYDPVELHSLVLSRLTQHI